MNHLWFHCIGVLLIVSSSFGFRSPFSSRSRFSSFAEPSRADEEQHYYRPSYGYESRMSPRLYNPYEFQYEQQLNLPQQIFSSTPESQIFRQSQMQAALLADKFLSSKFDDGCFERGFCEIATEKNLEGTKLGEQKEAVESTIKMLEDILPQLEGTKGAEEAFPHVRRLVTAYSVGRQTGNRKLCKWLFKCDKDMIFDGPIQPRSTCKAAAKFCPFVGVGCGMCAILAPEQCAVICPITAIYCGTAGIVCDKDEEAPSEEADAPEAEAEDDNDTDAPAATTVAPTTMPPATTTTTTTTA